MFSLMLIDHCSEQEKKLIERRPPELKNIEKQLRKTMVFQWLLLNTIVKHTIFNTFGSQISLQSLKNLRKPQVFLQTLSPEPLQNLSKIEILKS